jgi:hypothetical protein
MWKGRFPSTRVRFCTFELKHTPIKNQVIDPLLDKYDNVISWQGVRAQESPARADLPKWKKMQMIDPAYVFIVRSISGCMMMFLLLHAAMASSRTPYIYKDAGELDAYHASMSLRGS